MATEGEIFDLIGEAGFTRLVAGFYHRVKVDDLLGPLYPPEDFAAAEQRLRDFLIQRFGGPQTYSEQRGHPRLRMRHAPFSIDLAARNRWMKLMEESLAEAHFPSAVDELLRKYFDDTATSMMNTHD